MDCSVVVESLESLWFFSNVFSYSSSSSQAVGPISGEDTPPKHVEETVTEEISQPFSGNLQKRPNQSPLCAEKPVQVEPGESDSAESPSPGSTVEGDKRTGRSRGKGKSLKCRRKTLGEMDFGFYGKEILEEKYGGLYDRYKDMPPINDNMAMKEHIKSWAYTVACSVNNPRLKAPKYLIFV
ncbi:hypothetical protein TorRG33x02_168910 [Trema orientale]|uniref:Uncharacterized protein n=1 Tax=Trema orientale TaxID=63057 RepID=A0A2P5EP51_TREOI|nr:hypothetical protein TorRG33x02_168910 [Trema orientale]